jgi:vacuolar-type H+-ATPase subunit H
MELTVALVISILSAVMTVANFVVNRKDKAVKDAKETNMELINYRLNELDKNVQKILEKLDNYDNEIDIRIEKAMKHHINEYHK